MSAVQYTRSVSNVNYSLPHLSRSTLGSTSRLHVHGRCRIDRTTCIDTAHARLGRETRQRRNLHNDEPDTGRHIKYLSRSCGAERR